MEVKAEIKEIQQRVQSLGMRDIPAMFSCLENAGRGEQASEQDMIMHLALFGDMADCCFFMASILQKIIETHIPPEMSKELGMAKVRQMVLSQVENVYLNIQKNKRFELVKDFAPGQENIDDVPFVTQLNPKKGPDDAPDK